MFVSVMYGSHFKAIVGSIWRHKDPLVCYIFTVGAFLGYFLEGTFLGQSSTHFIDVLGA